MIYKSTIENILLISKNGSTLLTDGSSLNDDSEAWRKKREEKDLAYENARIVAWSIWFEAYSNGDISLDVLLRNARRSLVKLQVDDFLRWKTIGLLADEALDISPPRRSRGNKGQAVALRRIACEFVRLANEEGFVLSRASKKGATAFERASSALSDLGVSALPRQIEDWYYSRDS